MTDRPSVLCPIDFSEASRGASRYAVALAVVGVAAGCGFVSFELVAAPLRELMPAATLLGVPFADLAAGVIVLAHAALGVYVMDAVGVTELLPRLAALPGPRRPPFSCAMPASTKRAAMRARTVGTSAPVSRV